MTAIVVSGSPYGIEVRRNLIVEIAEPLAARVLLFLANVLVITMTWIKTYRSVKTSRTAGLRVNLSRTLLQDGTSSESSSDSKFRLVDSIKGSIYFM